MFHRPAAAAHYLMSSDLPPSLCPRQSRSQTRIHQCSTDQMPLPLPHIASCPPLTIFLINIYRCLSFSLSPSRYLLSSASLSHKHKPALLHHSSHKLLHRPHPNATLAYKQKFPLLTGPYSARFFCLSARGLKKGCTAPFAIQLTVRPLRFQHAHPSGFRRQAMCNDLRQMHLRGACMADFGISGAQAVFSLFLRSAPYVPPTRISDNARWKRHAADCGPSRGLPAAVNPAAVPVDVPMSSPHRSGITDAQATDCKSASTEDGVSFRTDRRRIVNHHRDSGADA